MLLKEVRSHTIALISAGVVNFKDTRLDPAFIDSLNNGVRAQAIRMRVENGSQIHSEWMMVYEPDYSSEYQNGLCYSEFKMIPTIGVRGAQSGIVFLGDGLKMFGQVVDRGTLASRQNDRIMKSGAVEGEVDVLIEGGRAKCYSKTNIIKLQMVLVPADPFDIPTWNPDVDPYPVTTDLVDDMENILTKAKFATIMRGIYDRLNQNGRDESAQPIPNTQQ